MENENKKPMKKIILMLLITGCGLAGSHRASAQADEIAQLLLNVEKLAQFKQILSELEKGYRILDGGYNAIKDLSQGNFSIHKVFLDGLMEVSPAVRNYRKVAEIVDYQIRIVREYRAAMTRFRAADLFRPDELAYIGRVYANLFRTSLRNLDELALVITAGKLRMSDDERLESIDRIHAGVADMLRFLRYFNGNTSLLAAQREREQADSETLHNIHGINR